MKHKDADPTELYCEMSNRTIARRRLMEDISLGLYVFIMLWGIPYVDSSSGYLLSGFWALAIHLMCVLAVCCVLILGMHLARRFGPYRLWGWRETVAVIFLFLYCLVGYLARPRDDLLKESAWAVCIIVQAIYLACAQYLEAWLRGEQGLHGHIEERKLSNQICWHLFTACWTALAAAIVVAGIVIGFGTSEQPQEQLREQQTILPVIGYLLFTVVGVFLWVMRPCFSKSVRIISGLSDKTKSKEASKDN